MPPQKNKWLIEFEVSPETKHKSKQPLLKYIQEEGLKKMKG